MVGARGKSIWKMVIMGPCQQPRQEGYPRVMDRLYNKHNNAQLIPSQLNFETSMSSKSLDFEFLFDSSNLALLSYQTSIKCCKAAALLRAEQGPCELSEDFVSK